eukprot:TRINITY_DN250_c0_g1_i1.p1 TRINITY_DN250_c0_g1~~TRINITY_DN250_c0_g1_i1.p1  ORF type:complete len:270 (+),score=40.40 TRINITY_DN250_c0_g1_i1:340-1149(+)
MRFTKIFGLFAAGSGAVLLGSSLLGNNTANCSSDQLKAPEYPWSHKFPWQSFDHASVRRGHQVYSQVCKTCHSLNRIAYRHLVDAAYTKAEAEVLANGIDVQDGPNADGEMYDRPGLLSDYHPKPYPNDNAARAANNGALPPDLSLIIKARPGGADYVFSLLTGYCEPPAGVTVREGLHYNPYFPGGKIGMAQPLFEGYLTYDDGTPNNLSQLSKDVTTFLCWASEPELDDRRSTGIKVITFIALISIPLLYYKRAKWANIKTRKIGFK